MGVTCWQNVRVIGETLISKGYGRNVPGYYVTGPYLAGDWLVTGW